MQRITLFIVTSFATIGSLLMNITPCKAETKSKLVVGITVNHFYPEWLYMYAHTLGNNGLNRIINGQSYMASYDYLYSQTGVDQATIYTGLLPEEHGIISHNWYDRLRKQRVNNIEHSEYRGYSPAHLQAPTIGCMMKMNDQFSKVYSVSVNAEEAILSAGSCANMALWQDEATGKWVSSNFYANKLPDWLTSYNQKNEPDFYVRRGWMPLNEEEHGASKPASTSKSVLAQINSKNKSSATGTFFYDIVQTQKRYNTYRVLKATPYANMMVTDIANLLIKEEKLGKDNDPDLLMLNYTCLDYMNRDYPVDAKEFQDLLVRFDKDIAKLLTTLDEKVGKEHYTVFMTFAETRELLPEDLENMRVKSDYFSIFKAVALLKSYLNLVYGKGDWLIDYDATQLYLNRALIEDKGLSLTEFQNKVADFMIEFEGVAKTLTANALTHGTFSQGKEALVQNNFSRKKSGDVIYYLLPGWSNELKSKEDFYFRHSKRNVVPLFFAGAGIHKGNPKKCKITDIVPILRNVMGMNEL